MKYHKFFAWAAVVFFFLAMVTGYLALRLLRYIANKGKFGWFAYYCWFAGAVAILLTVIL